MKTLTLFAAGLILIACSNESAKQKQQIASLKEEVMDLHDEVMPKMGEMRQLEKSIRDRALESSDSITLLTAADNLRTAHKGMMEWMRGYEPEYEGTNEEIIQYLLDQKASIAKVGMDMRDAIEEGQKLMDQ